MKKIFILFILIVTFFAGYSQPLCCPKFTLSADFQPCDTACRQDPIGGGAGGGIVACKNTAHIYTAFPNLPGFTFTWTVLGGTPTSFTGNPIIVTWGNSTQGFIKVVISNANGSCKDSISVKVCLADGPTAGFTFAPNPVCLNYPVQFTNTSIGGGNYYWDFGDGTSSTFYSPSHPYTVAGTYTVTLTVSTAGGGSVAGGQGDCKCRDTATGVVIVSGIPGIDIHTDNCKKMLCTGDTIKYCTSNTCTGYVWSVNGGTILNGQGTQCITVIWNQPSVFPTSVTLTANCGGACGNSATLNVPVLYPNLPIQGATVVCPASTTTYSLPALPGTFYKWTLSGGGVIVGADSNINFININWGALGGTFTLICSYHNPYSGCSGNSSITVTIKPPFKLTGPSPVCLGTTNTYTANGPVTTWAVSPNTGFSVITTTANTQTIQWTTIGNYTITATPTIPANFCTSPASLNVVVVDTPKLNSLIGPIVVCPNQLYSYSISSNMNAGLFTWVVTGGGTIFQTMGAHGDSVLVKWTAGGTISVSQTVNGCTSSPKTLTVSLVPPPTISGSLVACEDGTATYTASGALAPGSYTWSLINALGTITSGQGTNIITIQWHGTTNPGNSTCVVTVVTCGGSNSVSVVVTTPAPVTITQVGTLCSVLGKTLTSSLVGVSYQWFLNGSPTGTNTQSITVFVPGTYTVIVTPASGCASRGLIIIPPEPLPIASISANGPLSYCPGQPISTQLQALSNPGYCFQWYFNGNPIIGATSSTYTATQLGSYYCVVSFCNTQCSKVSNALTISLGGCCSGGCGANYAITITQSGCNPLTFTATVSPNPGNPIVWDFGDGFGGTGGTVSHLYLTAGNYTVCASTTATDVNGNVCCISKCVLVKIPLAALFGYTVNCGTVSFTNLSTNLPGYGFYSKNWTFPGGSPAFSNMSNPVVTYATSGPHTVTLTISVVVNGVPCTVSYSQIVNTSTPVANFTIPTPICALTQAPFSAIGSPAFQYHWDFGDTYASNLQNTTHAYATAGTYTVTLTVTDANGCTDIKSQQVNVLPALTVSILLDQFICPGNSITLVTTPNTFTSYQWFKNGVSTVTTPTYTTNSPDEYWVTVSNGSGCVATSNHMHVWNYPIPIADIQGQTVHCMAVGGSIFLYNSVQDPNYTYNWTATGPGSVTFSPDNLQYYANAALGAFGSYQFILTVTNTITGCTAKDTFCVIAYQIPTLTVSGPTGPLCEGTMYTFTAVATPANPNYVYHWSNGISGPVMTTAQAGTYFVSVTDPVSGCSATAFAGIINKKPYVDLFPIGCDTLCDTVKLIPPLPLVAPLTYGGVYSITWYVDNVPVFTGSPLLLSSLTLGAHQIYIVVTALSTGCSSTSGIFNVFIKHCGQCNCNNSFWSDGPYILNITTGLKTILNCNDPTPFVIHNPDCNTIFKISGTFKCADTICKAHVVYQLFDSTHQFITSSNDSLIINAALLANATYYVTIYTYCGDKLCDSCKITIIKDCPLCVCGPNKMVIHLTFNGQQSTVACGATLPQINCKDNVVLNATYSCIPAGCPDTVSYVLTGPVNGTGNLPLILSSLVPGTYNIFLKASCNGNVCDSCHLFFTVICDTPCCAYNIKVNGGTVTYTVSPTGIATIANQTFTILGLAGVNLTEVRAEVLSYNLSSNFNNECLGCKTFPFTWASINSATNIGAIVPLITLFGGTTPVFNPAGPPLIYQNPREIIWNNGGNIFQLGTSPLGIKFILPPPSIIDCCELNARICVKFTFRDDKCHECEVIVCFSVTIIKNSILPPSLKAGK